MITAQEALDRSLKQYDEKLKKFETKNARLVKVIENYIDWGIEQGRQEVYMYFTDLPGHQHLDIKVLQDFLASNGFELYVDGVVGFTISRGSKS